MPIKPPEPKASTKPAISVVISGRATVAQASHPSSSAFFYEQPKMSPLRGAVRKRQCHQRGAGSEVEIENS